MTEMLPILIPTAFPTLMVLVAILLNQRALDKLDSSLGTRMDRLDRRMDGLEGRFDKMRDQHHSDMMMIMGRDNDLDARISKLEGKREQQ
jgi:hypothetical protein